MGYKWTLKTEVKQYQTKDCVEHTIYEEWSTEDFNQLNKLVKDYLDVPLMELTIDEIRHDFKSCLSVTPEENLIQIQNYYNGRLALWRSIEKDLKQIEFSKENRSFEYEIPSNYISLNTLDNDIKNIYSKIEIILSI